MDFDTVPFVNKEKHFSRALEKIIFEFCINTFINTEVKNCEILKLNYLTDYLTFNLKSEK